MRGRENIPASAFSVLLIQKQDIRCIKMTEAYSKGFRS
jgi:hypothetical protein